MAKPLFIYIDTTTGARLTVDAKDILLEVEGEGFYVSRPAGEAAVGLARAVLAAAGDTGHMVAPEDRWEVPAAYNRGAMSMRERSAAAVDAATDTTDLDVIALNVRALPLLPDDDTPVTGHASSDQGEELPAERAGSARVSAARDERDQALRAARFGITSVQEAQLSAPVSDAARMLSEISERHAADDLGDESLTQAERDRLWLLGMVDHLRAKHAETHATSMRWAEQFTRAEAHLKRLTGSAGRSVETLAEKSARLRAADVHVATPEGITPCGQGTRDVTTAALISEVTCVECLRAIATERGEQVTELSRELGQALTPQLPPQLSKLPARVAQLERDESRAERRLTLLEVAQGRVDRLHDRVDALELAQREAAQSGGAPRAQVAGGGSPEPCPSTAYNEAVCIRMVCAYDLGHLSPHYNPADGGWEWDENSGVTQLNGRTPTP